MLWFLDIKYMAFGKTSLTHQTIMNTKYINSPRLSDVYMRHQSRSSSIVHIMAFRLFSATQLSEPMMAYCQFDPWKHISPQPTVTPVKYSRYIQYATGKIKEGRKLLNT